MTTPIRFGAFTPPIQRPDQNPTWALHRCLELVEWFDRIGYDEAWFGEHHSGGWELIGNPELFLAMAAERTKHIKLGTGVTSLPYHHPFLVAERFVMLDHLTRGRVILGAGSGALPSDARLLGIEYQDTRRRANEALEAIMLLLESDEPVSMETDWFKMVDAQLHLRPYTYPRFEITAATAASPHGARLAGQHGISLLNISASSAPGFDALKATWEIVEEEAAKHGRSVDRSGWRLVSFFHLADTEEQARKDCRYGLAHFIDYLSRTTPMEFPDPGNIDAAIDALNETGLMVIGTPDRMVEHLKNFQVHTGGFGGYLGFGHEMADREPTLHSHELLMRDVAPHFQGSVARPVEAWERMQGAGEGHWGSQIAAAQEKARADYGQAPA